MSEFGEFLNDMMVNAIANEWFWPVTIVCAVILVFILWLVFRRARLWYWKVNEQVVALESIDLKLQKIEQDMVTVLVPDIVNKDGEKAEPAPALEHETRAEEKIEEKKWDDEPLRKGKSGKIYTEEELEALIRE